LPASVSQCYGTVSDGQRRVHLRIVESGTAADASYVELGTCLIEPLPENLPEGTEIDVTITYDEQARVHVGAKVLATGQEAHTEIIRPENLVVSALHEPADVAEVKAIPTPASRTPARLPTSATINPKPVVEQIATPNPISPTKPALSKLSKLEDSSTPIPLCNQCGEPVDSRGQCAQCESRSRANKPGSAPVKPSLPSANATRTPPNTSTKPPIPSLVPKKPATPTSAGKGTLPDDDLIGDFQWDSIDSTEIGAGKPASSSKPSVKPKIKPPPIPLSDSLSKPIKEKSVQQPAREEEADDSAFWKAIGQE
jgi:molecular chaperone DnaK